MHCPPCSNTTKKALCWEDVIETETAVQYTRIRKWSAGVDRKEIAPIGPRGKWRCSWAVPCAERPKKNKKQSFRTNSEPSEWASYYGYHRGRGATCGSGDGSRHSRSPDRCKMGVCVCAYPRGVSIALRRHYFCCLGFPLRVIDNLESFSFPEWQVRSGAWLIVIQSHKRGHSTYT